MQLKQRALDSTAAFDQMAGPNYTYQGFDLAMWDWTALIDPDFMLSVVTCAQWGGWSDSALLRQEIRQHVLAAAASLDAGRAPPDRLEDAGVSVQAAPYLWLANDDQVSAVSKNWAGFKNTPQGPFNELNISVLTHVHQK